MKEPDELDPVSHAYHEGVAETRATVREWHPKCATCNSAYVAREKYVSVNRCAMGVDIQNVDLSDYYCSDHTDFDKEDESND